MRRVFCILLVLALLLPAGCKKEQTAAEPGGTAAELAAEILAGQEGLPEMRPFFWGSEGLAAYLSGYYALETDLLEDGAVCAANGAEAAEVAVLIWKETAELKTAEQALLDYRDGRADSYRGYVPDQAAMAENGRVCSCGRVTALFICPDPERAEEDFLNCFRGGWTPTRQLEEYLSEPAESDEPVAPAEEVPAEEGTGREPEGVDPEPAENAAEEGGPAEEPPEAGQPVKPAEPMNPVLPTEPEPAAEDTYHRDAVIAAWRARDSASLSGKDRAVYDACQELMDKVIVPGMSPVERELAIHDEMIRIGDYDNAVHDRTHTAIPDPDNENPYGFLVHGLGICRGYASSFQLLMDLVGIPCVTVDGASGREEHAWNMVQLEGEWYCVDVTWDDPVGKNAAHTYFNVTSDFLWATDHQWDRAAVTEATGTKYAWGAQW